MLKNTGLTHSMDTCFLFSQHLNDTGCLCLKIKEGGAVIAPVAQRSFSEIKTLQDNSKTIVVESTSNATLLHLELPWLPERKARVAIPYALEDKLAQPVEELHFAFDKSYYQNNQYLVAVIGKQRLTYIIQILAAQNVDFAAITLDWFALNSPELFISGSTLLINNDDFKGALSGGLAVNYLKTHPQNQPLQFTDSNLVTDTTLTKEAGDSYRWIAERLLKKSLLNLCQGSMIRTSTTQWLNKGYQVAGVLAGIWLISLLTVNAIAMHSLNTKIAKVDEHIAVIYHEYFPEAKQVISPRFRISQLLGNSQENQPRFWLLLNQFAKAMVNNKITVEQLRFQNKTLSVTLVSPDFASLEAIENKLRQQQLKVKQTQAANRDQHVVATLELM